HVFIQSFVLDLLLLTLGTMILPDPGVERVFIHAQITSGLGNGLIRLHGQFHGALLEFCGIFFGRGLTHRTHLIRCMMSLFPCVRKSVATSMPRLTPSRTSGFRSGCPFSTLHSPSHSLKVSRVHGRGPI